MALMNMRRVPRYLTDDPNFQRSLYIRYADDFVYLIAGTKKDAQNVKDKLTLFLKEKCGLELNDKKTIISNIVEGFDFLGARIQNVKRVGYLMKTKTAKGG